MQQLLNFINIINYLLYADCLYFTVFDETEGYVTSLLIGYCLTFFSLATARDTFPVKNSSKPHEGSNEGCPCSNESLQMI